MYDVIIAGGGPAGLSAAIYARRAAMRTLVLEGETWGGAILDAGRVDNYPGTFGVSGYDLADRFLTQARTLGAELLERSVAGISAQDGRQTVSLSDGSVMEGKTVILATGTKRTPLDVPGSKLPGVSYCANCDGAFFRSQAVCVIGGGDTAVDAALFLSSLCSKVYLIHRRKTFRAAQNRLQQLKARPNAILITDAIVTEVLGDTKVQGVILEDTRDQSRRTLDVNGVFVSIGSRPATGWLPDCIERDAGGYIPAPAYCLPAWPGLFVAGDVRADTFRQVVTAAADGANCVRAAEAYLRVLQ